MYADAFAANPSDFYTGINATSKAAPLGLGEDVFRPIAEQVAGLSAIRDPDKTDYWALAMVGEAKLLSLDIEGALSAYRDAACRHPGQRGSMESTRGQLDELLAVLDVASEDEERLRGALSVRATPCTPGKGAPTRARLLDHLFLHRRRRLGNVHEAGGISPLAERGPTPVLTEVQLPRPQSYSGKPS